MTHLLLFWLLVAIMLAVVWHDVRRYIIPNNLSLLMLILYVIACFLWPVQPLPGIIAGAIVFAVGLGVFTLGLMGGGDVKLLAVLALWAGWPGTAMLIILTALFGGLLVLIIYPLRLVVPSVWLKLNPTHTMPRILQRKQPIPYGLAIVAAFLWILFTHQVPVLAH